MCTAISMNMNAPLFGRTLDLECGYGEKIAITPRNYPYMFRHTAPIYNHCAIIGMAAVTDGYALYFDATNEHGLSIAGLNFPDLAHYASPQPGKINLASFELIPWLLCQCKTMDDVRGVLPSLNIVATPFRQNMPPSPLHWLIGFGDDCMVLEPKKDGLKWYDNPIGVMTNCPELPWHLTNLQNYSQLSPLPAMDRFSPAVSASYSRAMGAIGLPGDWSSASRFVRAAFVKLNSPCFSSQQENVNQFIHILQAVAMPLGSIQLKPGQYDLTRYSCCMTAGKYYYTTYENSRICCVDMLLEDLNHQDIIACCLQNKTDILLQNKR